MTDRDTRTGPTSAPDEVGGFARRGRQQGQATTEFVVLALVLVPLFIALPLIGKYLDLIQATEASSRYVAFEATVHNTSNAWRTDEDLATEVRRRFFSNSDAPVKTDDVAGDFAAHRNPLWVDPTGKPLLDRFDTAVGATGKVDSLNAVPVMWFRSALGLPNDNLYTGSVTVKIADIPNFAPFDAIGLSVSRKTVLLADPWTAGTPSSIRSKIDGSAVMYPIHWIAPLVDAMGMLPAVVFDPTFKVSDFDWGRRALRPIEPWLLTCAARHIGGHAARHSRGRRFCWPFLLRWCSRSAVPPRGRKAGRP